MSQDNSASILFRGIYCAARYCYGDRQKSTPFADLAQSRTEKNKTAITQSLNDFSIKCEIHGNDNYTTITPYDVAGISFGENMFSSKEGKKLLKQYKSIAQNDIYLQNLEHDGGLKFANKGDKMKQAALEFAISDINAIETAHYKLPKNKKGSEDGSLNGAELKSAHRSLSEGYSTVINKMNIDDNKEEISPKEYASALLVASALRQDKETREWSYNPDDIDGLITKEEAQLATQIPDEVFKKFMQEAYDEFYG